MSAVMPPARSNATSPAAIRTVGKPQTRPPLVVVAPAPAPAPVPLSRDMPLAWQAVDAAELDAARGGFQLPSGLAVGLGIERTVSVNGEVVMQTRFAIADVRALNADQAALVRDAVSTIQLVQNGRVASHDPSPMTLPASAAGVALAPVLGATIVQNSLDNQRIQSQTVIDANVNTLSGFKALNFSSTVLDALARAAGNH